MCDRDDCIYEPPPRWWEGIAYAIASFLESPVAYYLLLLLLQAIWWLAVLLMFRGIFG